MFLVVSSEYMHVIAQFLTFILFLSTFLAVITKPTVTVDNKPSGQLATKIPNAKIKLLILIQE